MLHEFLAVIVSNDTRPHAHHAAHGTWPTGTGGPVDGVPGEKWTGIQQALALGQRGLPGGTTLSQLLAEHGRIPARMPRPMLTVDQILAWADSAP